MPSPQIGNHSRYIAQSTLDDITRHRTVVNVIIHVMKPENWLDLAKMDFDDSLYLLKGARYPNAVYHLCQAVEKILKAAQVKFKSTVPRKTHQLGDLAKASGLEFTPEQTKFLEALTKDYGRVRYSDYARNFYNTKAKVEPLIKQAQAIYLWTLTKLETS